MARGRHWRSPPRAPGGWSPRSRGRGRDRRPDRESDRGSASARSTAPDARRGPSGRVPRASRRGLAGRLPCAGRGSGCKPPAAWCERPEGGGPASGIPQIRRDPHGTCPSCLREPTREPRSAVLRGACDHSGASRRPCPQAGLSGRSSPDGSPGRLDRSYGGQGGPAGRARGRLEVSFFPRGVSRRSSALRPHRHLQARRLHPRWAHVVRARPGRRACRGGRGRPAGRDLEGAPWPASR